MIFWLLSLFLLESHASEIQERTFTKPLVEATDTKSHQFCTKAELTLKLPSQPVKAGHPVTVIVNLRNRSKEDCVFFEMNCSWNDSWRYLPPLQYKASWGCDKNVPHRKFVMANNEWEFTYELMVAKGTKPGKFKTGVTLYSQQGFDPKDHAFTLSSKPVTLEAVP